MLSPRGCAVNSNALVVSSLFAGRYVASPPPGSGLARAYAVAGPRLQSAVINRVGKIAVSQACAAMTAGVCEVGAIPYDDVYQGAHGILDVILIAKDAEEAFEEAGGESQCMMLSFPQTSILNRLGTLKMRRKTGTQIF